LDVRKPAKNSKIIGAKGAQNAIGKPCKKMLVNVQKFWKKCLSKFYTKLAERSKKRRPFLNDITFCTKTKSNINFFFPRFRF
jgi:hypothetical protein